MPHFVPCISLLQYTYSFTDLFLVQSSVCCLLNTVLLISLLHLYCFCHSDIEAERAHLSLCDSIASFDVSTMRQVSTEERVVLPTQKGDGITYLCLGKCCASFCANFYKLLFSPVQVSVFVPHWIF